MKTRHEMEMKIKENMKKDPHKRFSFTKTNPPLIKLIYQESQNQLLNSNVYMKGKIPAAVSPQLFRCSPDQASVASESNETENKKEEERVKTQNDQISLPVVKCLDPNKPIINDDKHMSVDKDVFQVHPFIAEGLQEMRRSSVAHSQRQHELAQSIQLQRQQSDGIGPLDLDENYLMFGGDKSLKVSFHYLFRILSARTRPYGAKPCSTDTKRKLKLNQKSTDGCRSK